MKRIKEYLEYRKYSIDMLQKYEWELTLEAIYAGKLTKLLLEYAW